MQLLEKSLRALFVAVFEGLVAAMG